MRKIRLTSILIAFAFIFVTSCSKDDDDNDNDNQQTTNDCPLNSWLGDYVGTQSVNGGTSTSFDFEIREVNQGSFQITTFGETFGDFEPTSCTVTKEFSNPFGKDVITIVLDSTHVTWTREDYNSSNVLEETSVRMGTKQ